jgi:hypothetical protein
MQAEAAAATAVAQKYSEKILQAVGAMVVSFNGMQTPAAKRRKWSAEVYGALQVQSAAEEIQMRSLLANGSDGEATDSAEKYFHRYRNFARQRFCYQSLALPFIVRGTPLPPPYPSFLLKAYK